MSFEIEKDVPVPRAPVLDYPFERMSAGESFFVPCGDDERPGLVANRVRSSAYTAQKNGVRFVVRVVAGGARCWRVK